MYADYSYYADHYGGDIPEREYPSAERRAEQADGQTMEELIRKKAYEAASTYLLPTGWLSRKVGCCHADECDDYNL